MRTLIWAQVWQRRLAAHHLLEPADRSRMPDVAGDVCGIHAQIFTAAQLSIGIRVAGAVRAHVADELWARRRLVRSYGVRGTIHLFPAPELPLWMAALRTRPTWRQEHRLRSQGLRVDQLEVLVEGIGEALRGKALTRDELGREVARLVGDWALRPTMPAFASAWPAWMAAVQAAATGGKLCFGPPRGAAITFVRADEWVGTWPDLDPGRAVAAVCLRYLGAYGPATAEAFAQWFAIRPSAGRAVLRSLRGELEEVDVEGCRMWLPAALAAEPPPPLAPTVRLLPHYDCYGIGCHPRDRLVPPAGRHRVLARGAAGPFPLLLVDGLVAGAWRRRERGRRVEITVEPFSPLDPGRRALLEAEAARVGHVLGADPALSIVDPG